MRYEEILPHPALRQYVDFFWTLETAGETMPWEGIKLLPDGHLELTVNIGDPVVQRMGGRSGVRPQAFIGGMYGSAFFIEPQGTLKMAGVAFRPGKLQHFVRFPLEELCGQHVDMANIFGKTWRPVFGELQDRNSLKAAVAMLQQFLISVLDPAKGLAYPIEQALTLLYESAGNTQVHHLSKRLHTGERNFRRLFKAATGMGPKQFSRILRIRKAVQLYEAGRVDSLTALGYQCGYFDQAHFIHDFRLVAGESPGEYFSARRPGEIRF